MRRFTSFLPSSFVILVSACTTVHNSYDYSYYEVPTQDTSSDTADTAAESLWPTDPPFEATVVPAASLTVDLFGQDGNVYWFDVSPGEVEGMNSSPWDDHYGAIYEVEGENTATYADNLYVRTPSGEAANFGQVQVTLPGQSTWYPWTETTIPNIHVDTDEFQDGLRIGGVEHIRWNNNQVGSAFAEAAALATFNALMYAAPRTSFSFVGGSPWLDSEILVPYTAVEVYKSDFCLAHADFFGGGCVNIWEGQGFDINFHMVAMADQNCQLSECNSTRLHEFATVVDSVTGTQDFDEVTAEYIDWDVFRRFQCLEWLLWIGDDYLHNYNNIVLTEGLDGKFRFLPYSTDISAGMAWGGAYSYTELYGWSAIASGCQFDDGCWDQTVSTCEGVIDEFEALNPAETIIDPIYERLSSTPAPWGDDGGDGMLRSGDEERYEQIRSFYELRAQNAREELENYRASWSDLYSHSDTGLEDTGISEDSGLHEDTGM